VCMCTLGLLLVKRKYAGHDCCVAFLVLCSRAWKDMQDELSVFFRDIIRSWSFFFFFFYFFHSVDGLVLIFWKFVRCLCFGFDDSLWLEVERNRWMG